MEPVIDFLAEAELKAAVQFVNFVNKTFEVKQCRSVISRKEATNARKARKAGKHERIAKLIEDIRAKAAKGSR